MNIQPGDYVVVLGAGPIGMLFALLAKMCGAGKVVVSEITAGRREYASALGIEHVVDPSKTVLKEVVLGTSTYGADIVIDAAGSLLEQTLELPRSGGKILLFVVNTQARTTLHQFDITKNQLNIIGSFIFGNELFPTVVKVLESDLLPLEKLITHHLPLQQIHKGVDLLRSGEALKVIIRP